MIAEVLPVPDSPGLFRVVVTVAGVRLRSKPISTRGKAQDLAWVAGREAEKHYTEFFKKWARLDAPANAEANAP